LQDSGYGSHWNASLGICQHKLSFDPYIQYLPNLDADRNLQIDFW
jgi:hypothetical protein